MDENSAAGTTVATLTATDGDKGDSLSYSLSDNPHFEIDGNQVKVKAGADLDYESDKSHQVEVTVTDSAGNSYTEKVKFTVNDLNENNENIKENKSNNGDLGKEKAEENKQAAEENKQEAKEQSQAKDEQEKLEKAQQKTEEIEEAPVIDEAEFTMPVEEPGWVDVVNQEEVVAQAMDNPWGAEADNFDPGIGLDPLADAPDTAGAVAQINQNDVMMEGMDKLAG